MHDILVPKLRTVHAAPRKGDRKAATSSYRAGAPPGIVRSRAAVDASGVAPMMTNRHTTAGDGCGPGLGDPAALCASVEEPRSADSPLEAEIAALPSMACASSARHPTNVWAARSTWQSSVFRISGVDPVAWPVAGDAVGGLS
jgi:hypothetical protein